jgi:hypothetical protein
LINGRIKDFYDLWTIPKAQKISNAELRKAVTYTFERRQTEIPTERPEGLSSVFTTDRQKSTQWFAYAASIDLKAVSLQQFPDEVWAYLEPICKTTKTQ